MVDDVRVAEIAARAEKATPGPLHAATDGDGFTFVVRPGTLHVIAETSPSNPKRADDAELFARARDDIEYLLSEVRRLRSMVEDAEKVIAGAPHHGFCQALYAAEWKCTCWKSTYQAGADQ